MDLDDMWNVHFHDPFDNDWTLKSYHRLMTVSTCDDFWTVTDAIGEKILDGMFFVMREHIFPCWDDPENKEGGCFSIKVPKSHSVMFWQEICAAVLGETFFKDVHASKQVNGISISPKRTFCIFKIWMSKEGVALTLKDMNALPKGYIGDVIFKSWEFESV